jgi:hypothetical protein
MSLAFFFSLFLSLEAGVVNPGMQRPPLLIVVSDDFLVIFLGLNNFGQYIFYVFSKQTQLKYAELERPSHCRYCTH